ncbi:MAG TPA: cohesin domain-containing protein, partial [Gemmatimonadaceae bacterium]|nr:cohesin domain-containing protein [Gemmatimonadaceae bacterium]
MRTNLRSRPLLVLALVACASFAHAAHAATLSFTSASAQAGQTVSVSVIVAAEGGESLNGVSARVTYPTDKLTLLSLSKAGSVITFWAEEPSFSNAAGTASIEGIIPSPGYSGQGARVITLVFQAKAPGSATLSFQNASVLANDGRG